MSFSDWRPSLRARALPTSAASSMGPAHRRTRRLRIAFALATFLLLGVGFLLSRSLGSLPTTYFATGSGGVVVLDLSTSVDAQKSQRAQRVLRALSETEGRLGLIVFSDSAYEMLPPDTRSSELEPLLPFFSARGEVGSSGAARGGAVASPRPRESPWSLTFRGGTRISTGLIEARNVIEREGDPDLSVLLISDLDNSGFDTSALTEELAQYERSGIGLRVISLFPGVDDRRLFQQLAGPEAFVNRSELLRNTRVQERQTLVGAFPWALGGVGATLLLLLAANERLSGRLVWASPR